MGDHLRDFGLIDRRGWLVTALCIGGLLPVLIAGIYGSKLAPFILAAIAAAWCLLLQVTRGIMHSSLDLAKESTAEWQKENDFAREVIEDYVETIHDLTRYDVQNAGIHMERLRSMMVKRYPHLEEEIAHVQHPLNMPGIVI